MPTALKRSGGGAGKGSVASRARRHVRVRKTIVGTSERPRLVVTRSARHVFVQVVDDSVGKTLASASTMEADLKALDGDKTAKATPSGGVTTIGWLYPRANSRFDPFACTR